MGLDSTMENSLFILTHEATHHIQKINGSWYSRYRESGADTELPICSYSGTVGNTYEGMAEGSGLYVAIPAWGSCVNPYQSKYPLHYQFARDVMFK